MQDPHLETALQGSGQRILNKPENHPPSDQEGREQTRGTAGARAKIEGNSSPEIRGRKQGARMGCG